MTHHGWRKPTPDPELAEKLAQAGEQVTISKNRAFLAIKRIAAHIGLKPADVMLLDTFGAFTMPQDWEKGRRAIIWPSNACLIEQTGFSLRPEAPCEATGRGRADHLPGQPQWQALGPQGS